MKLVFLFGAGAVGKMTVGQQLAKMTGLRLFHNHMTIEPVVELFGTYDSKTVNRMREVIFEEFAKSDQYGMIFTFIWAFDCPSDWDFVRHIMDIFAPYDTQFYFAELVAPQEIRLQRNATENRLQHKASKRDVAFSESLIRAEDAQYRLVSNDGEIPYENYIRIDNSDLSPEQAAEKIKERFGL